MTDENKKQLIVSVSREFGSGGHRIAERIAEHFGIELYDANILSELANELGVEAEPLEEYDEKPFRISFNRTVRGFSTSQFKNVAELEFNFIKSRAEEGESFVIVGRCADAILAECDIMKIFVLGNEENKLDRIMGMYDITRDEAESMRKRVDARRRKYHNQYADTEWGETHSYDICISSDFLDIDGTADILCEYIEKRIKAADTKSE